MRVPALILAAVLLPLPAIAQSADDRRADPAAQMPSNALAEAWNRGDGAAWGDAFWPDADAVNVYGGVLHDSKAMGDRHAVVFAGRMKGSKMTARILKVRQLAPDVAILDTIQDIDPPGAAGDPARKISVYATLIIQRRHGTWKIVHMQNTRFSAPPAD